MRELVELRELRLFLTLAEELHFGRAAERLHLTPSRVRQTLRGLEHKLGGQLLHRTSRRVTLTSLGERFLAEIGPVCDQLAGIIERTHAASRGLQGTLRLGLLAANSGGPHLTSIIAAFEECFPGCELQVSEVFFTTDPLGPLRRDEIDLMATRLPIRQPDLVVGPTLAREPRVLAVARDHPLADRDKVSVEDIADYPMAPITDSPKELIDTVFPRETPGGRPNPATPPPAGNPPRGHHADRAGHDRASHGPLVRPVLRAPRPGLPPDRGHAAPGLWTGMAAASWL